MAAAAPSARPTRGLLGLSVVADGRSAAPAIGQLAALAGRLDLAGVWWREPPLTGPPVADLPALLDVLRPDSAAAVGLIAGSRQLPAVQGISTGYRTVSGFPIRLAVCGQWPRAEPWPGHLAELLDALGGGPAVPPTGEIGQLAMAGASAVFVPVWPDRDMNAAVSAAAAAADGRPVLVEVAVSVGRTSTEARARADGEELFAATGHPAEQGLFGTLEECQAAAARLRHAGATELVCYLPRSHDLPDVLAQIRAISAGAGALRPGEPPSAAPPPPAGWGGRRPEIKDPGPQS
jgi:hypothetical protein